MCEQLTTDPASMRLALSGASGLVGQALSPALRQRKSRIDTLVRRPAASDQEISWDPARGIMSPKALEGVDAVVHLAGENVGRGRWTRARRQAIIQSRVKGTNLLARTLADLEHRPHTLICASAVGYYGNRGDELITEDSPPGTGFLAELGQNWEQAAEPARRAGIRVVSLRIGMVLSAAGGGLPRMLTPFKLGLGGVLGTGRQYVSWISLTDLVRVICHVLYDSNLSGPINTVAPNPVTNRSFTKALGRVLHRPTLLPVPRLALRLAFGQMADDLLLKGARVLPARLQADGFDFVHPELEQALRAELGRP